MTKKRPFIVIEALDAGGSQTQTDLLADRLQAEKYTVHQYHFPQEDAATGRLIYDKFLLHKNKQPFSRREQALLFIQDFFSRADEMHRHAAQKNGRDVIISDRFCTSTMAYQTIGLAGKERQKMINWMQWLCWEGTPQLPRPDITIFLDTPVAVSLHHLKDKKKDFFESKSKLTAIRASYIRLAKDQDWQVFNSMDKKGQRVSKEAMHEAIWERVESLL